MKAPFFLSLLVILASSCAAQAYAPPAGPPRTLDTTVRVDRDGTLLVKDGDSWKVSVGTGYPTRVLGDGKGPQPRPLTSFAAVAGGAWWITTPFEGFTSADGGQSWTKVLDREELKNGANLTGLAASPVEPKNRAVGTTFHGLWLSSDAGKTWTVQDDLEVAYPYSDGSKEQINALAWSSTDPGRLYVSVGKEGGRLWAFDTATKKKQSFLFPGGGYLDIPEALATHLEGKTEILEVRTRTAWWRYDLAAGTWTKLEDRTDVPVWDAAKAQRMEKSKDKRAFYLSAYTVGLKGELDKHLDFMAKNGLNAVVIDFKNDQGEIEYDSQVPLAQAAKAVHPAFDAAEVIKKVHDKGFYLIARQVVFKDKRLYAYDGNKYALWDSQTKKAWGFFDTSTAADGTETLVQKEFWVDTYSSDVWDYNVAIAKELEGLGVDEVQFDYIRFPSDGPINRIVNRYKVEGMTRIDALESFLQRARAGLSLPISVDIYGYNGYFVTDHLGQNMFMMSKYVDAISAMLYPSHFWKTFLPKMNYFDRAHIIYQDGSDRTWLNTAHRVHARPWVQTFRLGGERNFTDAQGTQYVEEQLSGVAASKASGYLLWNSSNDYYMVKKPVTAFATTTTLPY
jgi:hypothetical protein